ncbi:unnamed protein product [Caenorhabditis auriculariae]|uniref:Uncharacterized protein n=1 Tax=Caenorhabditis auriculariae TaxID=2777116 RepID=A0A8S1HS06_9PELO|nr:unnamed protein product [Caenorhabditis auriculariae]
MRAKFFLLLSIFHVYIIVFVVPAKFQNVLQKNITLSQRCYTNKHLKIAPEGKDSRGFGDPVCLSERCVCQLKSEYPIGMTPSTNTSRPTPKTEPTTKSVSRPKQPVSHGYSSISTNLRPKGSSGAVPTSPARII